MIVGQYNGADIIALPTAPGFKQLEQISSDAVTVSTSPYTGVQQVQWWPGGDMLAYSIVLPQLTRQTVGPWNAFLLDLRGMRNVFWLGDPAHRQPQGNLGGLPVVDGAQSAMAATLAIRGLIPGRARQLLPNDHLQLGTHLHVVLNQVDGDANGKGTVRLWPTTREATADGDPIIFNNPRGLFRLAENKRSVTCTETRLSALQTIKCMEAR